jgi:hypothetical protein
MRKQMMIAAVAALLPALAMAGEPGVSALANRAVARGAVPGCLQENVSVSINFNFKVASPHEAKETFDAHLRDIDTFAKQAGLKKWTLQSMNYSVSAQNSGMGEPTYQLSGNASYQTDNADQAFVLMDQLSKQKMYVNVNVNKYNNGTPCPAVD